MGIVDLTVAQTRANDKGLDLVEVASQADPPVCKILDYGKWKYEQDVKAKEARKKQAHVSVKEMRFRPKISTHDFDTKKRHITRFLSEGHKVKIMVWFRGRERAHTDLGRQVLVRLADELGEAAQVEVPPKLDGWNMSMVLSPGKRPDTNETLDPDVEDEGKQSSKIESAESAE